MANRPALEEVVEAAQQLIESSAVAQRSPTVAMLAEEVGVVRSALYSVYPEAVDLIREARARAGFAPTGRPRDERAVAAEERARRARREADAATALAATYAEAIRVLTEENARLKRELSDRANIPRIGRA